MNQAAEFIVWASLAAVGWTYFVYPLLLVVLAPWRRGHVVREEAPGVTLVISAYNEAGVIREKIENALALDYPAEKLEIMVISDASDDGTDEIVAEFAERCGADDQAPPSRIQGLSPVVLCRQEVRQGKSAGLTRFVPQARGEIIVFSDANSMYEPDALRKLVRHFGDAEVGFVVGYQRYEEDASATYESESLYWRYETWLKVQESKLGSVVCGDGAIYAIRSALFEPLQPDDINDFILPLKIVAKGNRGIFDQEAACDERTAEDFVGEFRRKARIVNRSLRAVGRVPGVLNPFRVGRFAFQLFFHKVLRWFVPFFLAAILGSSLFLAVQGRPVYQGLLLVQAACYGLAALYAVSVLRRFQVVYVPFYFCLVNAAAAVGVLGCVFGKRISTWQPERTQTGEPSLTVSS